MGVAPVDHPIPHVNVNGGSFCKIGDNRLEGGVWLIQRVDSGTFYGMVVNEVETGIILTAQYTYEHDTSQQSSGRLAIPSVSQSISQSNVKKLLNLIRAYPFLLQHENIVLNLRQN